MKPEAAPAEPFNPTPFEADIARVKKQGEIDGIIRRYNIKHTGKYKDRPTAGVYYLFLINRSYEVPAVLKVSDDKTINLATGAIDEVANYKGCAGQWIIYND